MGVDVAEICAVFDLGVATAPPAYIARGELGRVSRLATTTGRWAVKEVELFVPSVAEADANVVVQESMLDAGVQLPRPRRTVDGHALHDNVRVYEWLDMTAVDPSDTDVDEQVAVALASVHLHAPPTREWPDPWYRHAPSRGQWTELIIQARGSWWAPRIAGLLPELTDLREPEHVPAHICHLDVCPENVFLRGGRLVIIDWENAGPAATVQDLGSSLWDFGRGEVGRTRAFVDAYRHAGGPLERLTASVFDTARVVQANLIDFFARRTLDPATTPEGRTRADRRLRESLDRVLTRTNVDEIVSAA
jgi:Ser/Thr protein kinase RdoA (MazF antagonist)